MNRATVNAQPQHHNHHTANDATILPPFSEQDEEAVLGAMLIDPDCIIQVSEVITPENFFLMKNALICQALYELQATQQAVDILTISNRLRTLTPPVYMAMTFSPDIPDALAFVGGESYIAQLTNAVPTALNALTYAGAVRDAAARRAMIHAAGEIATLAYNQRIPLPTVIERAQSSFGHSITLAHSKHRLTFGDALDAWFDDLSKFMREGRIKGIDTGFPSLNGVTGGYVDTKMYLITAPTGGGKTSWLKSAALRAAQAGLHVGIWSLEMSEEEYVATLVSEYASIDLLPENLIKQRADKREHTIERLQYEKEKMKRELPIHLHYRPGMRIDQFALEATMLQRAGQLDLIIFDYIQLARAPLGFTGNREQEVATVANHLKDIAGQLRVPCIAGAQLNDDGELRESRAIEMASDVHIQLKPKTTTTNKYGNKLQKVLATLKKNRSGAIRSIDIMHNMSHRKMAELAPDPKATPAAPAQPSTKAEDADSEQSFEHASDVA